MTRLNILTLNCWGIALPHFLQILDVFFGWFGLHLFDWSKSRFRVERIKAIGEQILKTEGLDVVFLQEVWVKGDYRQIAELVKVNLPFSYYVYSGLIGSGTCVFSKYPISRGFFHRYHLNGYPHRLEHCDYYTGSGAALFYLEHPEFKINLYVSHLHACYDKTEEVKDEYLAHRLCQAWELSQFIRATSNPSTSSCDAVIVAGDFNIDDATLEYRLLTSNAGLFDSWKIVHSDSSEDKKGSTYGVPSNSFTYPDLLKQMDFGERIDYILYRSTKLDVKMKCISCETTMGRCEELGYNYSDHEGVTACLQIQREQDTELMALDSISEHSISNDSTTATTFGRAKEILARSTAVANQQITTYYLYALGALIILALLIYIRLSWSLIHIAAGAFLFWLLGMIVVFKPIEIQCLTQFHEEISDRAAKSTRPTDD